MTITHQDELDGLQAIGRIVADTLQAMGRAMEPGMTTRELDAIGRRMLDAAGAKSAPEVTYGFPGATCISVGEEIAHGIPGDRVLAAGDLVNIDVSAEKGGFFADTGASFALGAVRLGPHPLLAPRGALRATTRWKDVAVSALPDQSVYEVRQRRTGATGSDPPPQSQSLF